jgi:hypothetical protein
MMNILTGNWGWLMCYCSMTLISRDSISNLGKKERNIKNFCFHQFVSKSLNGRDGNNGGAIFIGIFID